MILVGSDAKGPSVAAWYLASQPGDGNPWIWIFTILSLGSAQLGSGVPWIQFSARGTDTMLVEDTAGEVVGKP